MYAFDIHTTFWTWMDGALKRGDVGCPRYVFKEIVENVRVEDNLARWVGARKKHNLHIEPNEDVYASLKKVTQYVFKSGRYTMPFALDFMKYADPWIIAYAMGYGGKIVTQESGTQDKAAAVFIPDVCHKFNVDCVKVWDMLRELDVRL
jgi:hypothetical protein